MKIFQIVDNLVYYDMTKIFRTVEEARVKFPPTVQIVEAPDYVFESWGFNPNALGDDRFIKPTPPEGWMYDDETGTFYNPKQSIINERETLLASLRSSDYKVMMCYEASVLGKEMPYDQEVLFREREELRTQIKALEEQLDAEYKEPINPYGISDTLYDSIRNKSVEEVQDELNK